MKRENENWSDIINGKQTNLFLMEDIEKKNSWVEKYTSKKDVHLRSLCFTIMTAEQMISCPAKNYPHDSVVLFLNKQGDEIGRLGMVPNPKASQNCLKPFWRRLWKVSEYTSVTETIDEAIERLDKKREIISFVVEQYVHKYWNDAATYPWQPDWFSVYIYKTPKEFKNFSQFVYDTLARSRAEATKVNDA
jgi:hypothetical protein